MSSHRGPFRVLLHWLLGTGVSSVVSRTLARQHYYIISDQGSNKMHTDELQLVLWSGAASLLRLGLEWSWLPGWWSVILWSSEHCVTLSVIMIPTCDTCLIDTTYNMWGVSKIHRLTAIFIWVDKVKVDLRMGKGRHYRWPVLISWYCYAKSVQLWLDSRRARPWQQVRASIEKVRLCGWRLWHMISSPQWHRAEIIITRSSLNTTGTTSIQRNYLSLWHWS